MLDQRFVLHPSMRTQWIEYRPVPRYKFWTFVLDVVLASLTGGLWLLWPLFKFLRTGRR